MVALSARGQFSQGQGHGSDLPATGGCTIAPSVAAGTVDRPRRNRRMSIRAYSSNMVREGDTYRINAEEPAPGDIVFLESGDRVPADLRLLTARDLV